MSRSCLIAVLLATVSTLSPAQELDKSWGEGLKWRSVGPSAMGGRIIAIAVFEKKPSTWWAATASGGLVKTTNNGITFEHQFDREKTVSIGHVAVSQSDENIVWVGTGEANPRNSVSYGNGVYKSTDGGKTWKHMGLDRTFQTGRIAIHPTNPDIVYVGSLGRLYGPNEERGLFKTTDGGATWAKIHYVDDKTGVIDVDMNPNDPETLVIATYERERDGFDTNDPSKRFGPGGALFKTTDGGATWKRLTAGLPSKNLGRVGVDYYRKDPNVLMAIVESEIIAKQPEDAPFVGASFEAAEVGLKITAVEPRANNAGGRRGRPDLVETSTAAGSDAAKAPEKPQETPAKLAGLKIGDIVLAVGGKRVNSMSDLDRECRQYKAGDKVTFAVVRDRKDLDIALTFGNQPKDANSPFTGTLGGQAANLQDRQGPDGHEYGGVYKSTDGGDSWVRVNSLNPRPMYYSQIRIDPSDANNVMVLGTSLYRSTDGGQTFNGNAGNGIHVDHHAHWIDPNDGNHMIHGCDGGIHVTYDAGKNWDHLNHVAIGQFYHVGVSPERNYWVYGGLQDNGSWGGPSRTSGAGAQLHDWIRIGGGDGFRCLVDPDAPSVVYSQSQNGPPSWTDLKTGQRGSLRTRGGRGGQGGPPAEAQRFNWETPYLLSSHNSRIVYTAGNKVFKSLNRGVGMEAISPEITLTDRGSATALAESPVDADIVYVGTDDGALWVTRDGGANWIDCFKVGSPAAAAKAPAADEKPAAVSGAVERTAPPTETTAAPNSGTPGSAEGRRPRTGRPDGGRRGGGSRPEGGSRRRQTEPGAETAVAEEPQEAPRPRAGSAAAEATGAERSAGAPRGRGGRRRGAEPEATKSGAPIASLVPGPRWVSELVASKFDAKRAYVTLDAHRSDDDAPYVFRTDDAGDTWTSLTGGLPEHAGSTRTIFEDPINENLLYLGTEFQAFVSLDRGEHWTRINGNLPTVAVHSFAVNIPSGELVAGTHGRSAWIAHVNEIRQMTKEVMEKEVHFYRPTSAVIWKSGRSFGSTNRRFEGENPPNGARLAYHLKKKVSAAKIEIVDSSGAVVATLEGLAEPGLHVVNWDLRAAVAPSANADPRFGNFRRRGRQVRPGSFTAKLTVDGDVQTQSLLVEIDPENPDPSWITFEEEAEQLEAEMEADRDAQERREQELMDSRRR